MAKKSAVEKNERRRRMVANHAVRRTAFKEKIMDKSLSQEERLMAIFALAEMPRNGCKTRIRNRCEISGRPRAYYRKLKMSRIALREMGNAGVIPGLVKSSW